MAVRNFSEAQKKQKKQKNKVRKFHVAWFTVAVVFCAVVIGTCITNYSKAAEYKEQAQKVSQEISSLNKETSEIAVTLQKENHDEYFEKIAREEYGYCKPGEKVFYDSSYGE